MREDAFDILRYLYSKRIATRVATNGTLCTDTHIKKMQEFKIRAYATNIHGGTPKSNDKLI